MISGTMLVGRAQLASYKLDHFVRPELYVGPPEILGSLGARLGLTPPSITHPQFCDLVSNRHPVTRKKLRPRELEGGRAAYDFCAAPSKSVSLVALIGADRRVITLMLQIAGSIVAVLERFAAVRLRKDGANGLVRTGNLLALHTPETSSRAGDPHLHSHLPILNLSEYHGTVFALDYGFLSEEREFLDACVTAAWAYGMTSLGYELRLVGKSFEIAGVDAGLIRFFSRRTSEIEAAVTAEAKTSQRRTPLTSREKKLIGVAARPAKTETVSIDEQIALWRAKVSPPELAALDALVCGAGARCQVQSPAEETSTIAAEAALERVLHGDLFECRSALTPEQLLTALLRQNLGLLDLRQAERALEAAQAAREILSVGPLLSTPRILESNRRIKATIAAQEIEPVAPALLPPAGAPAVVRARDEIVRSPEQFLLVRLRPEIPGEEAELVAGLTAALPGQMTGLSAAAPDLALLPSAVVTKPAADRKRDRTCLLVRHAEGSGRTFVEAILQAAREYAARVIFCCDLRPAARARGELMHMLAEETAIVVRAASIPRDEWLKGRERFELRADVEELFARREPERALQLLDELEELHEVEHHLLAGAIARDFAAAVVRSGSVLAFAPPEQVEGVVAAIHAEMVGGGLLGAATKVVLPQRLAHCEEEEWSCRPGDFLLLRDGRSGTARGEIVRVVAVEPSASGGRPSRVETRSGRAVELPSFPRSRCEIYRPLEVDLRAGQSFRLRAAVELAGGGRLATGTIVTLREVKEDSVILPDRRRLPVTDCFWGPGECLPFSEAPPNRRFKEVIVAQPPAREIPSALERALRFARWRRLYTSSRGEFLKSLAAAAERRKALDGGRREQLQAARRVRAELEALFTSAGRSRSREATRGHDI